MAKGRCGGIVYDAGHSPACPGTMEEIGTFTYWGLSMTRTFRVEFCFECGYDHMVKTSEERHDTPETRRTMADAGPRQLVASRERNDLLANARAERERRRQAAGHATQEKGEGEEMHHVCPAVGCVSLIPHRLLMCRTHWAMVPRDLARRVYAEYAAQPGSPQHREACDAATAAVDAQITAQRAVQP